MLNILGLLAGLSLLAHGAPSPAKTSSACVPSTTYDANFDNLSVGSALKKKYAGCDWSGFEVVASNGLLAPSSDGHYIQTTSPEGSTVKLATFVSPSSPVMQLSSFYFGCMAIELGTTDTYIPTGCQITVISNAYLPEPMYGIKSYGPFSFTVDYSQLSQGLPVNMTRVDLKGGQSVEFFFDVTSGLSSTVLYIDDVVLAMQTKVCPTS